MTPCSHRRPRGWPGSRAGSRGAFALVALHAMVALGGSGGGGGGGGSRFTCSAQRFVMEVNYDGVAVPFEGDAREPDLGAREWCLARPVDAPDLCAEALARQARAIQGLRADSAASARPQTLLDGTSPSYELEPFTRSPDACTDNFHPIGRCALLRSLAHYVGRAMVPGDYVEAGVHVGDSAAAVAQAFLDVGRRDRKLWLYDSFAGMPEASKELDGGFAQELSPSANPRGVGWGHEASAALVTGRLLRLGAPPDMVVVREGWFNQTFEAEPRPGGNIAMLMVDGDWYGSVLETLEAFYDSVPPGGVVVIDDFGYWGGARRAFGDFIRSRSGMELPLVERYGPDMLWFFKDLETNRPPAPSSP